jgi:hypothetical protein
LRYETLVEDPDVVQQQIAQHFRLVPRVSFTNNPSGVRVLAAPLMRWQRDSSLTPYFESFSNSLAADIRTFCSEFGYDLPPQFRLGAD